MKLGTLVAVGLLACASVVAADECKKPKNIVDTAVEAGSFETLVTALKAADLVEALQSEGPFTVFAPTDKAFGKLPKGTLEDLLKPENKKKLAMILKYHVVPGKVTSKQVVTLTEADTLAEQTVQIDATQGVMINDATVIKADIMATNGVIHVIDKVLLPK